MTKEEFDVAFVKAMRETTGCVVFECEGGTDTWWYEGSRDYAWKVFQDRGCTAVRASREDEDTEL